MFVILFFQSSWYFPKMFRSWPYCLTMTSNIKTFPNQINSESSFLTSCTLFYFFLFVLEMQFREVWTPGLPLPKQSLFRHFGFLFLFFFIKFLGLITLLGMWLWIEASSSVFCRESVWEEKGYSGCCCCNSAGKARQPLCSCVGFWLLWLINRDLTGWHDCSFPLVEKLLYTIIRLGRKCKVYSAAERNRWAVKNGDGSVMQS